MKTRVSGLVQCWDKAMLSLAERLSHNSAGIVVPTRMDCTGEIWEKQMSELLISFPRWRNYDCSYPFWVFNSALFTMNEETFYKNSRVILFEVCLLLWLWTQLLWHPGAPPLSPCLAAGGWCTGLGALLDQPFRSLLAWTLWPQASHAPPFHPSQISVSLPGRATVASMIKR